MEHIIYYYKQCSIDLNREMAQGCSAAHGWRLPLIIIVHTKQNRLLTAAQVSP